jgi:MFS family permease
MRNMVAPMRDDSAPQQGDAPALALPRPRGNASHVAWTQVIAASLLMLATLPGRTQGLGLITEPLLEDLKLDRLSYARLNLWATILGAAFCFPAGAAIDRFGVRWPSTLLCLLLAAVVWQLSAFAGSLALLFTLLLATRALGQSALSVASISTVAKSARQRTGVAMAIFSVLLSVWFAVAFGIIGYVVREHGWRIAWQQIALVLAFAIAPLAMILLRHPSRGTVTRTKDEPNGYTLSAALRTPAFWVFTAAAALFNLVSSGLGLFNEAVLAERGFPRNTFHHFLVVTTLLSLAGQLLCGWLTLRWSMRQISAFSLLLYAAGLGMLPFVRSEVQLWIIALFVGLSGGLIIVIFFTVWPVVFGRANVGQIQGAAQVCTVISSAIGPVLFAKCFQCTGSYSPALWILAGIVLLNATAAWRVSMPQRTRPP